MKKELTFGQRMDLAIKLANYFLAFVFVGFLTATIGGGMGYVSLLILGILLFAIGITFFVVSIRVRYYEKKPDWLRDAERKIEEKIKE